MEAITVETLIEDGKHIMEWLGPLLTKEEILQLPAVQKLLAEARQAKQELYHQRQKERIEQGIEKGIKQAIEQGAQQEALASLLRILPHLFGTLQPELVVQIKQLTLPQLRQAVDLAFDVADLPEFEAQITAWLAAPKL